MPNLKDPRQFFLVATVAMVILLWAALLIVYGPRAIVEYIGVENAYLVIFLLAISGGLSSMTSAPFYAALATFAAGGADPLLLGLVAGASISVGDMLFFTFGKVALAETRLKDNRLVVFFKGLLERSPRWGVPGLVLGYTALTPFPNDLLMVPLGTLKERFWVVAPWLAFGNTIQMLIVTFSVWYGSSLVG